MSSRLLDAFHQASAARSSFEASWRDIAALIHPTRSQFQGAGATSGSRPTSKPQVYDSTALIAAEQLAAGLFSALGIGFLTRHDVRQFIHRADQVCDFFF